MTTIVILGFLGCQHCARCWHAFAHLIFTATAWGMHYDLTPSLNIPMIPHELPYPVLEPARGYEKAALRVTAVGA